MHTYLLQSFLSHKKLNETRQQRNAAEIFSSHQVKHILLKSSQIVNKEIIITVVEREFIFCNNSIYCDAPRASISRLQKAECKRTSLFHIGWSSKKYLYRRFITNAVITYKILLPSFLQHRSVSKAFTLITVTLMVFVFMLTLPGRD